MVIHIGEDEFISNLDLIMILHPSSMKSANNQTSLDCEIRKISFNETKSFIVTKQEVIESPVDSKTLYKRDDVLKFFKSK